MAQAVVDPEELRQFAHSLKSSMSSLATGRRAGQSIGGAQCELRDQEHKKFADEFESNMKVLLRFAETSDEYVPYLLRKRSTLRIICGGDCRLSVVRCQLSVVSCPLSVVVTNVQ